MGLESLEKAVGYHLKNPYFRVLVNSRLVQRSPTAELQIQAHGLETLGDILLNQFIRRSKLHDFYMSNEFLNVLQRKVGAWPFKDVSIKMGANRVEAFIGAVWEDSKDLKVVEKVIAALLNIICNDPIKIHEEELDSKNTSELEEDYPVKMVY